MSQENIIQELREERLRQDEKWGAGRNIHPLIWLTILGEEYGEACRGSLQAVGLHGGQNTYAWQNYRDELIQLAAVTVAAIESFDRNLWE